MNNFILHILFFSCLLCSCNSENLVLKERNNSFSLYNGNSKFFSFFKYDSKILISFSRNNNETVIIVLDENKKPNEVMFEKNNKLVQFYRYENKKMLKVSNEETETIKNEMLHSQEALNQLINPPN